jgi:hypothetical protein
MFTKILSNVIVVECVGAVFFFSRGKRKKDDELDEQETYKNHLLCRFVLDGAGKKVGESVAIDEDLLIIKSKGKYLGVPLSHIEEKEKTLLVKGLVDRYNAELMGEKWRRESFREIEHPKEE